MRLEKQADCPEGEPFIGLLGFPVRKDHKGKEAVEQEYQQKKGLISGILMVSLSARIFPDAPE